MASHLAKQALTELATTMLTDGPARDPIALESALADRTYNRVAMLTGTKVIHVSERNTQVSALPKQPDELVNTWSIDGLDDPQSERGHLRAR
jgi:homospermidine synthase